MSLLEHYTVLQNKQNDGPEEDQGVVCGVKT